MYLIAHLYGNREEQKKWHVGLRNPLRKVFSCKAIERFVMTYHYGGNRENLYLCIDVPSLSECTLDALLAMQSLKPIVDYLAREVGLNRIEIGNYEEEVSSSLQSDLMKKGFENASYKLVAELAKWQTDKASRGCAAALKILSEGPTSIREWGSLATKVFEYSRPLNRGWFLSDSAHFCLNSLGVSSEEEDAVVRLSLELSTIHEMLIRLFKRESWTLDGSEERRGSS